MADKSKKKTKRRGLLYGGIAVLGFLAVAAAFSGLYLQKYQSVFLPGIAIAGTEVGGLTPEAAADQVLLAPDLWEDTLLDFYYEDKIYPVATEALLTDEDCVAQIDAIWQSERDRGTIDKTIFLLTKRETDYSLHLDYSGPAFQETVATWQQDWNRSAKNASIAFNGKAFSVAPEQVGLVVDVEATLAQLSPSLHEARDQRYPLLMQEDLPAITADDFKNMGEIAAYGTNYNPGEVSRTHNLVQATSKINRTVLKPGEEFSFNKTVGIREAATGYRDAMVIVNGKYEPGLGGGICQVSSTLYNAALLSGLTIVERHNHALAVAYVPVGRDATVVYGVQDFRFTNSTRDPIYIAAQAGQGRLAIAIYGNTDNKQSISISNPIDQVIPFQDTREEDAAIAPGTTKLDHNGANGYVVRTYRNYLDGAGNVLNSEFLAKDSYQPLNRLTLVGPAATAEVENHALNTDPVGEEVRGAVAEPMDTPKQEASRPEPLETIQPIEIPDPPQVSL